MKNASKLQRAAMGALVAAALVVGVGQANAGPRRFPEDNPSRLREGRARILDDGSGGMLGRLRLMLASVRRFDDDGPGGVRRFPAKIARRGD